ncbi:hypothetical protein TWF696_004186 [Orbilia brochopaga]|uniref:Uncharacterized protein n=1 Tax=Orbilia brochopaga TaxID=3140254 RepID=A0AAV9V7R5_9PEZI
MCLIGTTERRYEYPVARRVAYAAPRPRQETVIVERPRSSYDSGHFNHGHNRRSSSHSHHRHSKTSVHYATPRGSYVVTPRGSYVSTRRESVPVVVERTHR